MVISDQLNLIGAKPLRGKSGGETGHCFVDLTQAYSPELIRIAREAARNASIRLREGVYAAVPGPAYETPSEVRMLRTLGADAVGMSTVPEVIALNQCGAKVLGISSLSNLAAGMSGKLSHEEVLANAGRANRLLFRLFSAIFEGM